MTSKQVKEKCNCLCHFKKPPTYAQFLLSSYYGCKHCRKNIISPTPQSPNPPIKARIERSRNAQDKEAYKKKLREILVKYGWPPEELIKELLSLLSHQTQQAYEKGKQDGVEDKEKWLRFFSEDIKNCFIPKCNWCGKIATKQTVKGEEAQKNNERPVNWGYYCKSCFDKGLKMEEEEMYG